MINAETRFAILDVIARYSYAYDSRDADGFANLFIEDAVWEYYFYDQEKPSETLEARRRNCLNYIQN